MKEVQRKTLLNSVNVYKNRIVEVQCISEHVCVNHYHYNYLNDIQ